jgi:hypothetical protein
MDKTPGQVLHEHLWIAGKWQYTNNVEKWDHERAATAVIAHVRPQIEAEARAAAMDDFFKAIEDDREELPRRTCDKIISLASAPPGHVCVPVEPTEEMAQAGDSAFEGGYVKEVYFAMLAARPK